jgi:hypothetical protein
MKQAEVIQNHDNVNVQNIGKSEAQNRKGLKLVAVRGTIILLFNLP